MTKSEQIKRTTVRMGLLSFVAGLLLCWESTSEVIYQIRHCTNLSGNEAWAIPGRIEGLDFW